MRPGNEATQILEIWSTEYMLAYWGPGNKTKITIMMYIICVVKVKLCSSNYWFYVQRHYMHISLQYIVAFLDVSRQFFACERGKIHLVICLFSFQCKCDELLVPCLFNLTQDIRYEYVL